MESSEMTTLLPDSEEFLMGVRVLPFPPISPSFSEAKVSGRHELAQLSRERWDIFCQPGILSLSGVSFSKEDANVGSLGTWVDSTDNSFH